MRSLFPLSESTKKILSLFVAGFILLIVVFINPNKEHGWGGDFALYIHEAIHIAEGEALDNMGYIINEQNKGLSPQHYPVGFPLILSIPYQLFGYNISAFSYTVSFFLFLSGFISFLLFRLENSFWISLLGAIVIVFNPYLVDYSTNILPDIPLMFFIVLALLIFRTLNSKKWSIVLSFVLGFIILIKSIGIAVWMGIIAALLIRMISKHRNLEKLSLKKTRNQLAIIGLVTPLFYILIQNVVFRIHSIDNYISLAQSDKDLSYIWEHIIHYSKSTLNFFMPSDAHSSVSMVWGGGGDCFVYFRASHRI